MGKEEVKREIDKLRTKCSNYGWSKDDVRREEELQETWKNLPHFEKGSGYYVKAPEL